MLNIFLTWLWNNIKGLVIICMIKYYITFNFNMEYNNNSLVYKIMDFLPLILMEAVEVLLNY